MTRRASSPSKRIAAAAIKTPRGVVSKKPPARHKDVARADRKAGGTGKGERGFVVKPGDEFVGRQKAKKVARAAGQARVRGRRGLHSRDILDE